MPGLFVLAGRVAISVVLIAVVPAVAGTWSTLTR